MLFEHFSHVPERWMVSFPNFTFKGDPALYCPADGSFFYDYQMLTLLQRYRFISQKPVNINSGHRSPSYNARLAGAPLSQHLRLAFDISLNNRDHMEEYKMLKQAGFTSFGFYETFIHVDRRPGAFWFGSSAAKRLWQSFAEFEFK